MLYRSVLALLGFFILVSCGDDSPTVLPPVNEYLVVGNDRGFRDDFINQANLITVYDSSIAVRSLRSVENVRKYPIVNGYVMGGSDPALHWAIDSIGQDTISLLDTSRSTTFYLHRLSRVDSLPTAGELLTSGEIISPAFSFFQNSIESLVFNDMGQGAGCLIERSYFPYLDWTKISGSSDPREMPEVEYYVRSEAPPTLWRLYGRFAQPILVRDAQGKGMTVSMLDSVSVNGDTLYGYSINDRSFKNFSALKLIRSNTTSLTASQLQLLPQRPVYVEEPPAAARKQHRRRWPNDERDEDYLAVFEEDLPELSLRFNGDDLTLSAGERTLASRPYRMHETAPYLIVGDECDPNAHWHYRVHGDSVTMRIPLRVEFSEIGEATTVKMNGQDVTVPAGRWYAAEEWKATFLLE